MVVPMRSKFSHLSIFVLTGSFLLLSTTVYTWCGFMGGCKLGRYQANVTLTDAATQQPMANMAITPVLASNGSPFFGRFKEEGTSVITDNEGQADLEFNRIFFTRLKIEAVSEYSEVRGLFEFDRPEIREDTTISRTNYDYLDGADGREQLQIVLEIGDWSLF
jgi:hypothetical protein